MTPSPPPSPWKFFGLDPAAATEADLKAAYARLLRQHRPDQDPAGFQRLRGAFEAARTDLQRRSAHQDGDLFAGLVPESSAPPAEAPRKHADLRAALGRLTPAQQAQPNEFHAEFRRVRELFFASFAAARKNPADLLQFSAAAAKFLSGKPALLDALVSPEMLAAEIAAGSGTLTVPALLVWEERRRQDQLDHFQRTLKSQAATHHRDAGALALAEVAAKTGFFLPRLAAAMADGAFPGLPAQSRSTLMNAVDSSISLGKIFETFPHEQKMFWWRRVYDAPAEWDWENGESNEARDYLLRHPSRSWVGWEVIQTLTPPGWMEKKAALPVSRRIDLAVKPQEDEEFWELDDAEPSESRPDSTLTAAPAAALPEPQADKEPPPALTERSAPPPRSPRRSQRASSLPAESSSEEARLATMGRRRGKPRRSPIGRIFGPRALRGTLPGLTVILLATAVLVFLLYVLFGRN